MIRFFDIKLEKLFGFETNVSPIPYSSSSPYKMRVKLNVVLFSDRHLTMFYTCTKFCEVICNGFNIIEIIIFHTKIINLQNSVINKGSCSLHIV